MENSRERQFHHSNFYSRDRLAARLRETGGPEKGEGYGGLRFVISYQKYRDDRRGLPMSLGSPTCAVQAGPEGACRDERA
jgi:hypothetical protein